MPNVPKYKGMFTDKFAGLTSQMKSNFTRKYNKQAHMAQHLVAEQSVGKTPTLHTSLLLPAQPSLPPLPPPSPS